MGISSDKESRIAELETRLEVYISSEGPGACAGFDVADVECLKEQVNQLDVWVNQMYEWAMTEDVRNEERIEHLEKKNINVVNPAYSKKTTDNPRDRKPSLEHEAVQNRAQLTEGKDKYRNGSQNALTA